ncbi:MAG TPA: hypothetical protein VHE12_03145 [bacterium]|nr:hypothetical protein [bacterium]
MRFSPLFSPPRSKALAAALALLPWFVLQWVLFRPYYLVNDDILKVLMAKGFGSGGVHSDLFEGSNALLGIFFERLYAWAPHAPWFGWSLYGLQALALTGLFWAEVSRPRPKERAVLFLLALVCVYSLFFLFLQFNIVSILSVQSGVWLLLSSFETRERAPKTGMIFLALVLFGAAFLLRPQALWLGLFLAAPLFIPSWGGTPRPKERSLYLRWLVPFAFLVAAGQTFHAIHLSRSPEWKAFWAFHREADGLNEYRSARYDDATRAAFEKAGWSANDLWLFKNWYWMDPVKFSTENLKLLNERFPRWGLGAKYGAYSSWGDLLSSHWDLRILLWALGLSLFCGRGRIRPLLSLWGTVFLALAVLLYWLKATDRVTLPVLVFLVSAAVHFAEFPAKGGVKAWGWRHRLGALFMIGLAFLSVRELLDFRVQNLQRRSVEARFDESLKGMESLGDRLIVLWDFPLEAVNAFDDLERFRPFHLFLMSSSQRSPAQAGLLKEYGLEDFGKGLVDNPRVLLNCSPEEGVHLAVYLQERYGLKVRAVKAYDGGYFKVFSLRSVR